MKVIALQSGSDGNCYFVRSGEVRLIFDAGISGRQAEQRLSERGEDIRQANALFLTHDHRDHSKSIGIFHRQFELPVYLTRKTWQSVQQHQQVGRIDDLRFFRAGEVIPFEHLKIHSIPTPHDGVDGVVYVIEDGQHRLGILTDLGHVFDGLREVLQSLDAVILESNYDHHLLSTSDYPEPLKQRIRGHGGHLSNDEAARLLAESASDRLQWACLCHLSNQNNCPDLAFQTHRQQLRETVQLYIAHRDRASEVMEL